MRASPVATESLAQSLAGTLAQWWEGEGVREDEQSVCVGLMIATTLTASLVVIAIVDDVVVLPLDFDREGCA